MSNIEDLDISLTHRSRCVLQRSLSMRIAACIDFAKTAGADAGYWDEELKDAKKLLAVISVGPLDTVEGSQTDAANCGDALVN